MKKADIFEFYRRLAELNPSPETELEFGNTYQLLVAVVLSAQATDVGVNKATRRLFQEVKTPQEMVDLAHLGEEMEGLLVETDAQLPADGVGMGMGRASQRRAATGSMVGGVV